MPGLPAAACLTAACLTAPSTRPPCPAPIGAAPVEPDLCNQGFPRASADAIDRPLHPPLPPPVRRYRARRRHTEIVVSVEMHGHAFAGPLANLPRQILRRLGTARSDRVDD